MKKKVYLLLPLLLVFVSCRSTQDIVDKDRVMFGMIYDYDNSPVNMVTVLVDGTPIVQSDIQGRFVLPVKDAEQHTIELKKDGYEVVTLKTVYDPVRVLYFKMFTATQLLNKAETMLERKEYNEAKGYLERGLSIAPYRTDISYLLAVIDYKTGKYESAESKLEAIIKEGTNDSAVKGFLDCIRKKATENNNETESPKS